MEKNTQSRKWNLVINNPAEAGLDHQAISEKLARFHPQYFCISDEIAHTGTYHSHVFFYCPSPARFGTVKKRFPTAHIEKAYGSAQENREYILKNGKWSDTDKADTSVPDSFVEWGTLPSEQEEKHPAMARLLESVDTGLSSLEIIRQNPALAFRMKDIDQLREALQEEKFMTKNRDLTVSYLYGASGTGKTRSIFARHDPRSICRITHYGGPRGIYFDAYRAHEVLVFEEFHSQVNLEDMLNFLDIYPLFLPARYNDRVACYSEVYITSNYPLSQRYPGIQAGNPKSWQAFLRRIHNVVEFNANGTITIHKGEFHHDENK